MIVRHGKPGDTAPPAGWPIRAMCPQQIGGIAVRPEVGRTDARKVVRHFFTRISTALVTLLPSFDSNFSGRFSNPKQCFQVSLSTS